MSNAILTKYREVRPTFDESQVNTLQIELLKTTDAERINGFVRDDMGGTFCVFTDSAVPNRVLEYVKGSEQDSVSTLYENTSPIFSDLGALRMARRELIGEIGARLGRLPSTISVYDGGREREVALNELGTAQLMDVLARFTGTDLNSL